MLFAYVALKSPPAARHTDLPHRLLPALPDPCQQRDGCSQISNLDLPYCKLIRFLPVLPHSGHGGRSIRLFSTTTSDILEKTRSHLPLPPSAPAAGTQGFAGSSARPRAERPALVSISAPSLSCCSESSSRWLKPPSLKDTGWGRIRGGEGYGNYEPTDQIVISSSGNRKGFKKQHTSPAPCPHAPLHLLPPLRFSHLMPHERVPCPGLLPPPRGSLPELVPGAACQPGIPVPAQYRPVPPRLGTTAAMGTSTQERAALSAALLFIPRATDEHRQQGRAQWRAAGA